MATETRIEGLSELYKTLQSLPAKVEGNVMRGALRAALTEVRKEVQAEVPVDAGDLRKSVRIRFRSRSQKFGVVRMNLIAGDKVAWYAGLIEFGTGQFYAGSGGRSKRKAYKIKPKKKPGALLFGGKVRQEVTHPGIKPNPFMRRAFDQSQARALETMKRYIATRLPRELKKAGR